jgi:hypothetical protein
VRNAKKTHNEINIVSVNLSCVLINRKKPKTSSNTTTITAKIRACFSKKGILKTAGEKYSSNLKENPTASTAFTKPEAINIKAIKILSIFFSIFIKLW